MIDRDDRLDYFEANQGRLAYIATEIERLARSPDGVNAEQKDNELRVTGTLSPESIGLQYEAENLDNDSAAELNNLLDEVTRKEAAMSLVATATEMRMHYVAQYFRTTGEAPAAEELNHAIGYTSATWEKAVYFPEGDNDAVIAVSRTGLSGTNAYGNFITYSLEQNDGLLTRRWSVRQANDKIINARMSVAPSENELLHETLNSFSGEEAIDQISLLLVGRYENEDELDMMLNKLWLARQGALNEEEVRNLLNRVRERAIAAKHASELSVKHDMNLPSIPELDELKNLLENL